MHEFMNALLNDWMNACTKFMKCNAWNECMHVRNDITWMHASINEWMFDMNELNECMNDWMTEWIHGWMTWMNELMNDWYDWMTAWMHGWMNAWMNAWVNECMTWNEWMHECMSYMNECMAE